MSIKEITQDKTFQCVKCKGLFPKVPKESAFYTSGRYYQGEGNHCLQCFFARVTRIINSDRELRFGENRRIWNRPDDIIFLLKKYFGLRVETTHPLSGPQFKFYLKLGPRIRSFYIALDGKAKDFRERITTELEIMRDMQPDETSHLDFQKYESLAEKQPKPTKDYTRRNLICAISTSMLFLGGIGLVWYAVGLESSALAVFGLGVMFSCFLPLHFYKD